MADLASGLDDFRGGSNVSKLGRFSLLLRHCQWRRAGRWVGTNEVVIFME